MTQESLLELCTTIRHKMDRELYALEVENVKEKHYTKNNQSHMAYTSVALQRLYIKNIRFLSDLLEDIKHIKKELTHESKDQ